MQMFKAFTNPASKKNYKISCVIFQIDPHGTAKNVSPKDRVTYENQTIPTLLQLLDIAHKYNKKLMFDLTTYEYGIPREHPYVSSYADKVIQTVVQHDIPQENVS